MKLSVVAVDVAGVDAVVERESLSLAVERPRRWARGFSTTAVGIVLALVALPALMAPPAHALDGIDLSKEAAPAAAGECPALIQIKYPFLSCKSGQIGLASGNATWENSRQIPRQGDFNEGNGYWGDELNRD